MEISRTFHSGVGGYNILSFIGEKLSFLAKHNCRLFLQFNPYQIAMFTVVLIAGLPPYQASNSKTEDVFFIRTSK